MKPESLRLNHRDIVKSLLQNFLVMKSLPKVNYLKNQKLLLRVMASKSKIPPLSLWQIKS